MACMTPARFTASKRAVFYLVGGRIPALAPVESKKVQVHVDSHEIR